MTNLLAIVGPTASGKSDLAMKVAEQLRGEIICADSRTIYRGMNIGTAKPTAADQAKVPHHLLDIIDPDQSYSAAEFKREANRIIREIEARGRLPILCGGTGLYLYAVLYDYQFPAGPDNRLRQRLQKLSIDQLVDELEQIDPEAASSIDLRNPRRVIRAIETAGQPRQQGHLRAGATIVGLWPNPDQLDQNIDQRTQAMLAGGLEREVSNLLEHYGPELEVLRSPGYIEIAELIAGKIDQPEAERLIKLHTRQLAKRQQTWFKRNQDIKWFQEPNEAYAATIGDRL